MNILEKIAADKRAEIQMKKEILPLDVLQILPHFNRTPKSLSKKLKAGGSGIIAEFKRRSPSRKELNLEAKVEEINPGYERAGASGISVLTDEIYFGGSMDDLLLSRELVQLPILRKDFIIDDYQIYEAKAIGADVILLIAALLTPKQITRFTQKAKDLGLEVLLEVHDEEELEKSLIPQIDMIGVNNRNLKTFEVDLETSKRISKLIPQEFVKISESGISSISAIQDLRSCGFKGFLIGETFMKTEDPGKSAEEFIKSLSC